MVYVLNVLARIMGFFLRIDHSLERPVKTIAVCKFVGMGSIVQSTPLLKTLRKNYPSARIIYITNISNVSLFHFIDEVNEVFHVSDKSMGSLISSNFRLLLKLWKNRPDVYIDLEIYSNYSSVITTMSLARNRMGFFKDDKTYRKGMYTHMIFYNIKSPVSQTYLQFARLLGCKEIIAEVSVNASKIDPGSPAIVNDKLSNGITGKYILINPNASDLRLERRWPKENFVQLIRQLSKDLPGLKMILVGDRNESEYVKRICSELRDVTHVLDSSGKLTLPELITLIAGADLLITNDTGPMHLAFALKVPTVSLFGPCSPQQYGGTAKTISVYKNVYCSPCVHDFLIPPCKGDNQCMKKIGVTEVTEAVRKAMQNDFGSSGFQEPDYINSEAAPLGVVLR
jgi:ADP-heptose:LPS heptosyltransferase